MASNEKNTKPLYAIIRVSKIKSFGKLYAYQNHVNREVDVPNADKDMSQYNYVLRGNDKVVDTVKDFMKERNLEVTGKGTTNQSVLCSEMLITASPDFFKNENGEIDMDMVDKWALENDKWLKDQYGDNYLFSKVHLDEKTPHLSIIIQPTSYHNKYKKEVLSHKKWFGKDIGKGYNKLKDLQDEYPKAMQEAGFDLQRGQINSKAKHRHVQKFYTDVNNVNDAVERTRIEVIDSQKSLIEDFHEQLKAKDNIIENQKVEINARNEIINKVGQSYGIMDQINEAYPIAKQRAADKMKGIDVNKNINTDADVDVDDLSSL